MCPTYKYVLQVYILILITEKNNNNDVNTICKYNNNEYLGYTIELGW